MSFDVEQTLRAHAKNQEKRRENMRALDRPEQRGYAHIFKANNNARPAAPSNGEAFDKALKAFRTNSAIATRLSGTKPW